MVLAAGLTSRSEPASFSRRMSEVEAMTAIAGLVAVASSVVSDADATHEPLTFDRDDDYLAHAALQSKAYLVTRDDAAGFGQVLGLRVGRPGTALRLIGALDEAGEG